MKLKTSERAGAGGAGWLSDGGSTRCVKKEYLVVCLIKPVDVAFVFASIWIQFKLARRSLHGVHYCVEVYESCRPFILCL